MMKCRDLVLQNCKIVLLVINTRELVSTLHAPTVYPFNHLDSIKAMSHKRCEVTLNCIMAERCGEARDVVDHSPYVGCA